MALTVEDTVFQVLINANPDGSVKYASYQLLRKTFDPADPSVPATFTEVPFAPVEATGKYSLPGIFQGLQAATIAANAALTTEVAAVKKTRDELLADRAQRIADKAADVAAIKAINDELRTLKNPGNIVKRGILNRALRAPGVALTAQWNAGVNATIAALTTAKDADPQRINTWWDDTSDSIDSNGADWALIISLRPQLKASEAALLAEIAKLQAA